MHQALLAAALLACLAPTSHAWGGGSDDRVLLKDVEVLTLRHGGMTAGRRSPPVPQLVCVGGDACAAFQPTVMQCRNVGHDGRQVQWSCKADMDDYYRLGETTVSCEGYKNRKDKYILAGSCGVEYTLHYTEKGRASAAYRAQQGTNDQYMRKPTASAYKKKKGNQEGFSWAVLVPFLMVGGMWLLINKCSDNSGSAAGNGSERPPRRPTGGVPPPPPPYSAQDNKDYATGSSTSTSARPGFWTGAATGAAAGATAGYMAGRMSMSGDHAHSTTSFPEFDDRSDDENVSFLNGGRRRPRPARTQQHEHHHYHHGASAPVGNGWGQQQRERTPSPPETYASEGFGGTRMR
ncbi:hypothetical protein H9P43_002989 [Blastocladiella emersonii ATCC 22665]|nr:hypothetical protein H9P43_002989 [Blastocladiella emersonii ATCC 22665]